MSSFLYANSKFWRQFTPPKPSGRHVVVDLMVTHPCYTMINCVMAKALQLKYGYEPIGIYRPGEAENLLRSIAYSYGINITFATKHPSYLLPNVDVDGIVDRIFAEPDMAGRRTKLLSASIAGLPVGDLVYDTLLRFHHLATLPDDRSRVHEVVSSAFAEFAFHHWLTSNFDIAATVLGHIVYVSCGGLARFTAARGGEVFSRNGTVPTMLVRRYRAGDPVVEFERHLSVADMGQLRERLGDRLYTEGRRAIEAMWAGQENPQEAVTDAYATTKRSYGREELLYQLGMDPKKPVCFIIAQVYSDGPHSYAGFLFDDYAQQLIETCRAAEVMTGINWIVREHPSNHHYNPEHNAATLLAEELRRSDNIALCPDDLAPRNMDMLADAAIAVGSMAVELSCMGVPCIVPGRGAAFGHGFTYDACSRADYFALMRDVPTMQPLGTEQIRRAFEIAYTLHCTRFPSTIVPAHSRTWFNEGRQEALFDAATRMLETADLETDPLYRNFVYMLDHDLDHMFPIAGATRL